MRQNFNTTWNKFRIKGILPIEVLLFIGLFIFNPLNSVFGQEIKKYKNHFPEDMYLKFLEEEEATIETSSEDIKTRKYLKLAFDILEYSDHLSRYYGFEAFKISEQIKSDSLLAVSSMRIGLANINIGEFDKSANHLDRALKLWTDTNDSMNLSLTHIYFGYLERSRGNPYKGIEHLYKAKAIRINFYPLARMIDVTNRLVIAYSVIGDYQNVVNIADEFLTAFDKTDTDPRYSRNIMFNMHTALIELKEFERANEVAKKVIPLFLSSKRPKTRQSGYWMAFDLARREGNFELSKIYSDSSLMVALQTKNNEIIGDAYFCQYTALKNINRPTEALVALEKSRQNYIGSNRKTKILEMAEAYSFEMSKKGNYKKAYNDLYLADSLRKQLFQEDLADKVRNLEKKIIQEENQKQVSLLNDRNSAIAKNLSQEKNLRYLLLSILGITISSVLLLWNFYTQRKTLNVQLLDKNQKLEVALEDNQFLIKEVHHRVKNNMQVIASLLNLQSRVIKNDKAKEAIIASKSRILSMSLLHKNIYGNDNLKSVNLQVYFADLLDSLDNTYFQNDKDINISSNIGFIEIDLDMAVQIGLLTNEIISNSYKHAFTNQKEGNISVSAKMFNSELQIVVSDNGIGISPEQIANKSNSLGIRLINSFTKKLKAKLAIDYSNGTTYSILLPLKK